MANKITLETLAAHLQKIDTRIEKMDARIERGFEAADSKFAALADDISELRGQKSKATSSPCKRK